ncbi:MAG: hypothetical protein JRH20_23295 [Deltaproteobacteria bacterium]|nr:hypothetical protein [Deltaproteobacteria bacterium]
MHLRNLTLTLALTLTLTLTVLVGAQACSSDKSPADDSGAQEPPVDARESTDRGQGLADGGERLDGADAPDGGVDAPQAVDLLAREAQPPALTSLQVVLESMDLPTSGAEYAGDVDGDGDTENQAGVLMGVLAAANMGLQGQLDRRLAAGYLLLLLDLHKDAARSGGFEVQAHVGEDQDSDPRDNFSGNETFDIDVNSPNDALMAARMDGAHLKADGKLVVGLPLASGVVMLTLNKAHLEAEVSSSGMQRGWLYGALPMEEVDTKLLNGFADILNGPNVAPSIAALFDLDQSGDVTAEELKNSPLLAAMIKADVDTDGDGKVDAMSFGAAFTAVSCVIAP